MYSFDSRIRYSEVGADRRLTMSALLDYFQDCSIFHSESVGLGIEYLEEKKVGWVLASWDVKVDRYPMCGEMVKVSTWAYDFKGFFGYRNFTMQDESGELCASASSVWIYMDLDKKRPTRIAQEIADAYGIDPALEGYDTSTRTRNKIADSEDAPDMVDSFRVGRSQIDTNNHMNNAQYVMVAQEYLPQGCEPKQMQVEYKKSAMLDDELRLEVYSTQDKITIIMKDESDKVYCVIRFGI